MKRYVLLEGKNVVDTKDRPLFHIEENTLWHNSMLQGTVINQSDNLLDLLEVGDMVEYASDSIQVVDNEVLNEMEYIEDEIIAIWKRQQDVMRRYKV